MDEQLKTAAPAELVRLERRGSVSCVTIANPPVNVLSAAVRAGLAWAIDAAEADPETSAVLLVGQGGHFIAGADIREFSHKRLPPLLPDLCDRIEACSKPVIAALRGATLGGGLEVALAAHHRVALT